MSTPPPVVPRLAASVAILRHGPDGPEVMLTHRPATMAFGPGLHVFPGGSLDVADADAALLARVVPPSAGDPAGLHGLPFVVAAMRETWEEAGVLLASGPGAVGFPAVAAGGHVSFAELVLARDMRLRGDWLVPLSRWVTPPVVPRRYDARIFVAWLPDGAVPAFHEGEVAGHEWLTPVAALEAMADGRLSLWMPTSTTLQQLAGVRSRDDVRALAPVRPAPAPETRAVEGADGLVMAVDVGGAGGVPGTTGRTWLVGRRACVVVDPGDPSDEAADALLGVAAARGATIGAVLVSSADPACAAGGEGMALRLGVPLLGPGAARRLLAADVGELAPGEIVRAADVVVRVVASPDGRADAIGYAPEGTELVLGGGLETRR